MKLDRTGVEERRTIEGRGCLNQSGRFDAGEILVKRTKRRREFSVLTSTSEQETKP